MQATSRAPTRALALAALFLVRSALPTSAGATPGPARASADTVRIDSGRLRIGFDAARGRLVELQDVSTGRAFVDVPDSAGDVWLLDLPAEGARTEVAPRDAGRFTWARAPGGEEGLRLEWSDFGLTKAPGLRVTVTVRARGDAPMSGWSISLEGLGTLGVEQVRFPRVAGIRSMGADEALAVPRWMGQLARDAARQFVGRDGGGRRQEWPYPGTLSMQLLALYSPGGAGLYLAADDTLAYRKSFVLTGDGSGGLTYEITQLLPDPSKPKERWAPAYTAVVGSFQGDWLTAAEIYRTWGTRQPWARDARLARGLVPDWLLGTGMWVWNRGRSPGVVPPALALRDALGLPVSIYWHWWHHGPYDTSFPDYLPPREGVDSFEAAVGDAHAQDVHAMVYMNQRLWCTHTPSYTAEGAARWAVKARDGKVHEEVYNVFDPQPCVPMDVTTAFWRDKYAGIADTVINQYGVDAIYMDQAVQTLVCWDSTHGHPVGGGNYWIHGFQALEEEIRARAGPGHRLALSGEGAGEAWLPLLDLMLTLQVSEERYSDPASGWEPIPMFQAVYHAYGITYGSYSSLSMPPYDDLWPAGSAPPEPLKLMDRAFQRQFYLEQARSFVWGLQPTIANFLPKDLTERPEETAYMMRLARIRSRALDFLQYGTFLRPPALDAPDVDVHLSRVSIYAAQKSGPVVSEGRDPAALAGAWRAKDGSVAVAVASILDTPSTVTFAFDAAAYGLPGGGRVTRVGETGSEPFGTFGTGVTPVRLDLPAGGALVLEFRAGGAGGADASILPGGF
jgi:Domain of unknown function (DUF6259)